MLKRVTGVGGVDAETLFAPLLPFDRIGVAVSGGPDSLGLMLLSADWARCTGKTLIVYTVDHRLRPESAGECAMVAAEAERLGLVCRRLVWSADKPKTGVQAAARVARYRLIGAAMREDGAEVLVTAHHRDDQAETVLMRLAHGSGLRGLGGMALFGTLEGVRVCRPLLGIAGPTLRAIASGAGLVPAEDPSNRSEKYERTHWRRLLPVLGAEGLDSTRLAGFARRAARADRALETWADAAFRDLAEIDGFGVVFLDADPFFALPEEIGLRLLSRAVDWAGGGEEPCRLGQIETAYDGLLERRDGFATTFCGAVVAFSSNRIRAYREAGRMSTSETGLAPGATLVWDRRFSIATAPDCDPLVVVAGTGLTRVRAETFCGQRIDTPMAALHAAPVVSDRTGTILAIGTFAKHLGLEIVPLQPLR